MLFFLGTVDRRATGSEDVQPCERIRSESLFEILPDADVVRVDCLFEPALVFSPQSHHLGFVFFVFPGFDGGGVGCDLDEKPDEEDCESEASEEEDRD